MKRFFLLLTSALLLNVVLAQDSVTVADYQRAQQFLGAGTSRLVKNGSLFPNWIDGSNFWYSRTGASGRLEYYLVNGARNTRVPAFNSEKLAAALSKQSEKPVSADKLNPGQLTYSKDMKTFTFTFEGFSWTYNPKSNKLVKGESASRPQGASQGGFGFGRRAFGGTSPDGTKTVFIKDDNLWIREVASGKTYPLTKDGIKDYGYATDNAGWKHSDNAVVSWSPDSKMIFTFKQDQRLVGDMYLVTTNVGHPKLESWKYPLPGDEHVAMLERVVIHVDEQQPRIVKLKMERDYHRATTGDDISGMGGLADVAWSKDGSSIAFVSSSRDHKVAKFRIANPQTGDVRDVFSETSPTQFESGQMGESWQYLPETNEVVWYSERDNYGHLYLYDLNTGKVKNQITKGNYVVANVTKTDLKERKFYFNAFGLDPVNPYYRHFCVVNFDGTGFRDLTPEEGDHRVSVSPSGEYFVNTYSQPHIPPVFNLRNIRNNTVLALGEADVSELKEKLDWKPVTPFKVKAADGVTDIYGLMYTPTKMEPGKKYPVVDYIYPGPQAGSIGANWAFSPVRGDHQALAELGFVVVMIEGTCNPYRTKAFHDMCYGNMGENTLPDQIAGIKQLAEKYPFMDINKVGIWGHSGGGFATAAAMLKFPDFFKVGISESGNHDNRNYEDDWGERYIGLLKKNADGTDNYTMQANQMYAENLKGKLLLVHGLMDNNVPPYNTLLVVKALQDANKDFDLIIFPDSRHGFGKYSNYMMRTRWDYFVKNLKGALHPKEFKIGQ
ncbi:MAG: DPP IV N-terminal domain-containing protein [Chitinophagaceae bacterium]|nr:DPP IV N-terminal domain-containing protein [Chitinophagaceae bacterium]MCW5913672.1 DPP IV N-terminal domain-containing protein [Chitinophagaceae bacterium]MCZ2397283.1 S9 family peptidase [Chitinophagales bacterium]